MSVSPSLALKTLGYRAGINAERRTLHTVLRHSSRGVVQPTFDRYSTIRSFFKRQLITSAEGTLKKCATDSMWLGGNRLTTKQRLVTFGRLRCSYSQMPGQEDESKGASSTEGRNHGQKDSGEKEKDINLQRSPDANFTIGNAMQQPLNWENYPRLYRRLAMSLSHLHRPSRDDFLRVATGFWDRVRIRFKWFTIRSFRRFNADDISAFITWFLMSQTLWILIGTTTFFSVLFATLNSLRLQENVARAISNYLTSETGITIIFESAIVPKWKDSRISFKNVYISRRPRSDATNAKKRKYSGLTAAIGYDISTHPATHGSVYDDDETFPQNPDSEEENTNYSMFDLNIDSIDVTLSLKRWLDGKGLVEDAVIKGVRGILDRRSVTWDPDHPLDPLSFRHVHRLGDFELNSVQLEDVLITVHQPGDFRPYTASIFRADFPCLRKQWFFYDFLSADNVVGQIDNCLFSLHKPQTIGRTTDQDLKDGRWGRMARFRIDGVHVDHLQAATTQEGPLSWILSGKVDAVFDIKFPRDPDDDFQLPAILGEIADAISGSLERIPGQRELAKPPLSAPTSDDVAKADVDVPRVTIDIDLRFRDLKAAVPLFTNDLSYVNSALIRPIVAFMNAHRTLVPIHCRVVKDLADFEGAWTMWETGLMDEISLKTYEALAHHVTQVNMNRRVRAVSVWSLQMTASAIISALRSIVDPMAAHLRDAYMNGPLYDVKVPAE